jgi:hypothetical protein
LLDAGTGSELDSRTFVALFVPLVLMFFLSAGLNGLDGDNFTGDVAEVGLDIVGTCFFPLLLTLSRGEAGIGALALTPPEEDLSCLSPTLG